MDFQIITGGRGCGVPPGVRLVGRPAPAQPATLPPLICISVGESHFSMTGELLSVVQSDLLLLASNIIEGGASVTLWTVLLSSFPCCRATNAATNLDS